MAQVVILKQNKKISLIGLLRGINMGKVTFSLSDSDIGFIKKQKLFFVASCSEYEVNLSPKGYDSLRVLDNHTIAMIDFPGSGNKTARDIENNGKVSLLFTSFDKIPRNLKIIVTPRVVNSDTDEYTKIVSKFKMLEDVTIRQVFVFDIIELENSCGMSIPYYSYIGQRDDLIKWNIKKTQNNTMSDYIKHHNIPKKIKNI